MGHKERQTKQSQSGPSLGASYLLRVQRIAALAQVVGLAMAAVYPFMPGHHPLPMEEFIPGICITAAGIAGTALAPWSRWVGRRWVMWPFYGWTMFLLCVITWLVMTTGGESSPMWVLYVPICIFAATVYPRGAAGSVLVAVIGASLVVGVLSGWDVPLADLVVRLSVLALTLLLAAFLAEERYRQAERYRRSWETSASRARMLATVAGLAEPSGESDIRAATSAVLARARELGFDVVGVCRAAPGEGPFVVESCIGIPDDMSQAWRSALTAMAELSRGAGRTVVAKPGDLPVEVCGAVASLAAESRALGRVVLVGCSCGDSLDDEARREGFEILARLYGSTLEQARLLDALSASEARFRSLARHAADAVMVVKPEEGSIVYASPAWEVLTGRLAEDLLGTRAPDLLERASASEVWNLVRSVLAPPGITPQGEDAPTGTAYATGSCRFVQADGTVRELDLVVTNLMADPSVAGIVVTARDVTCRRASERARVLSEEQFRLLADLAPVGTFVVDQLASSPRIVYANRKCRDLFGDTSPLGAEGGTGSWTDLLHPDGRELVVHELRSAMAAGQPSSFEHRLCFPDGRVVWADVRISPVLDSDGVPSLVVGVVDDVSARRRREERLEHVAGHDPLTGLGNRSMLTEVVSRGLSWAQRSEDGLALLYCDLDRFKEANDRLGHQTGDVLLVEVAKRLREALRAHDTAIRVGGDEFLVACEGIVAEDARGLAERLFKDLARPYALADGSEASLSVSVGVAFSEDGMATPAVAIAEADAAMYEAKRAGAPVLRMVVGEARGNGIPKVEQV